MGRVKGTKRITLNNGMEEWFEFCNKEDALAYVERGWCSTEDVVKLWTEKNINNEVTMSEMEEHMESIEDTIDSFNNNFATLMEAIKTLTKQREIPILQQNIPAVTEKQYSPLLTQTVLYLLKKALPCRLPAKWNCLMLTISLMLYLRCILRSLLSLFLRQSLTRLTRIA
jgi:thymidylate synthase